MNDIERDELLIRLDERVGNLVIHFSNHIKHHWAVSVPLALVAIGLVIKLFI